VAADCPNRHGVWGGLDRERKTSRGKQEAIWSAARHRRFGFAFGLTRQRQEGKSGGKAPHSKALPAPLLGGEAVLLECGAFPPLWFLAFSLCREKQTQSGEASPHSKAQRPIFNRPIRQVAKRA
jgi:hypothetical protein